MNKIGILTFYISNYGSVLQAYSTKTFLAKHGYTPVPLKKVPFGEDPRDVEESMTRHPEGKSDFDKFMASLSTNKSRLSNRSLELINDFIENSESCTSIEIEIIPKKKQYGKFINIINKEDEKYFHIYFNDNKTEIKKYNILKNDKVFKINIKIDYQIKSFYKLFDDCKCIEYITFNKFYRNNISDMSSLFSSCISLKKLDLSKMITCNVTSMKLMFSGCSILKELDLSNFDTSNVTNMCSMFSYCQKLEILKINNFNTKNVKDMSCMFENCSSINYIPVYNFNTNNVKDMSFMFFECSSLKDIVMSNFNFNNSIDMSTMFYGCSDEFKLKIQILYKNIPYDAYDYERIS